MVKKYMLFLMVIICFLNNNIMAWGHTLSDNQKIKIGVIDTGLSENHNAFSKDQISEGMNFVFPEQGTDDKIGHGTIITSLIIGAETEWGKIEGSSPEAIIVPLVYQSRYPSGVTKNGGIELMAKAIISAIDDYNCKVLCISSGITTDDEMLREAVFYAEKKDVVIVAAVGNDNEKNPEKIYYPASYDTVISIGALNENDEIAEFSQRHGVFAAVQGKDVTALSLDGTLKKFSGTSYANAYAAGIVANLLSEMPNSTPEDIRNSIALSAYDLGGTGYDLDYGWGKINADEALEILKGSKVSNISDKMSNTTFIEHSMQKIIKLQINVAKYLILFYNQLN